MPKPPVPEHIDALLKQPNPAVLACIRPNGTPQTSAVWYRWTDGRILLTFDRERVRLRFIRRNPAVSLAVLDSNDWFRHVTLFGNVVEIFDDEDLRQADEMSYRYMNRPYPDRQRPRVCGWMQVDSWFAWNAYAEVKDLGEGGRALRATRS